MVQGGMMQEDIINGMDDAEGRDDAEREHYNEGMDDAGGHYKWEGHRRKG